MVSSLITGAIMIILLLVASYVIVGSIINTSETLIKAQYDASAEISKQIGTDIRLNNSYLIRYDPRTEMTYLWIDVRNVGRVPITDSYPFDLLIVDTGNTSRYYSNVQKAQGEFIDTESGKQPATINQGILDPGEGVSVGLRIPEDWNLSWTPYWAEVITKNGISSSAYISNITPS
jgi:archaellum component FlaG (FlaF/FlaG flagellin family)